MTRHLYLFLALGLLFFAAACVDDTDPLIENEEEVITAVTLTLFSDSGEETVVLGFSDPDGDGGDDPVFSTTGTLVANSSYRGQLSFANETGSIDAEIVAEGTDHQVFYQTIQNLNLTFSYLDDDANNQPIGLMTQVTVGGPGSGNLIITLKHEPGKNPLTAIGNPELAGGETDVEVSFAVTVE